MQTLPGELSIGHVRYSTAGSKAAAIRDVQPFFGEFAMGGAALAHNGNLTNADALRRELIERGSIFQSSSDSECIIHLMARSLQRNIPERMEDALRRVEGAFSVVAMTRTKLIGVRDPLGVRPLVIGKVGDGYALSSETCALDIIGAEFVREVEPGEMVVITDKGIDSNFPFRKQDPRFCIFEHVYFSRPDSIIGGRSVYETRRQMALNWPRKAPLRPTWSVPSLTVEHPPQSDFHRNLAFPLPWGSSVTNTWDAPLLNRPEQIRNMGVRLKLNVNRALVKGKRIILVDDLWFEANITQDQRDDPGCRCSRGAFPYCLAPNCMALFYGVDTPQREKLLAATMSEEEMRDHLAVDSLKFISLDGLYRAVGEQNGRNASCPQYCDACFSGEYPVAPSDMIEKGFAVKAAE